MTPCPSQHTPPNPGVQALGQVHGVGDADDGQAGAGGGRASRVNCTAPSGMVVGGRGSDEPGKAGPGDVCPGT